MCPTPSTPWARTSDLVLKSNTWKEPRKTTNRQAVSTLVTLWFERRTPTCTAHVSVSTAWGGGRSVVVHGCVGPQVATGHSITNGSWVSVAAHRRA